MNIYLYVSVAFLFKKKTSEVNDTDLYTVNALREHHLINIVKTWLKVTTIHISIFSMQDVIPLSGMYQTSLSAFSRSTVQCTVIYQLQLNM